MGDSNDDASIRPELLILWTREGRPAPDMIPTSNDGMDHGTFSMHARHTVTAVVTGKPLTGGRPAAGKLTRGCDRYQRGDQEISDGAEETRVVVQGSGTWGVSGPCFMKPGIESWLSDVHGGITIQMA